MKINLHSIFDIPHTAFRWLTATRRRKILSIILVILITLAAIRFIFLPVKVVKADTTLKFDEGYGTAIHDANSTVANGTVNNALWRTDDLCFDQKCLFFDGTGDSVYFSDDSSLDMASSDTVTITGWFRTTDISSGQRTLIAKYETGGADGGYKVYMNSSGQIIFGTDNNNSGFPADSVTTTTAFDDNRWHHFATVKNGTTSISLFIDANLIGTDSSISAALDNNDTFYIGIDGDGSSNGWVGFIDEVKIYRSARSAAEIKSDYLEITPNRGASTSFSDSKTYLSDGLIGYWRMDEASWTGDCSTATITDYSGNGNNGIACPSGSAASIISGKFGNAGNFDGTNDYANLTTSSILRPTNFITTTLWVKRDGNGTGTNPHITRRGTGGEPFLVDRNSDHFMWGRIKTTQGETDAIDTIAIPSTWTHYALVYDGANVILYRNGQVVASSPTTGTLVYDNSEVYIGGDASNEFFNGDIDEFRIYNRALSPAEVQTLFKWAPGPLLEWKFDENTGTTNTFDTSGNNFNGTMNGSMTASDWVPGIFGSALELDGSNDYISTGDDDRLDLIGKDFTLEAWVKFNTLPSVTGERARIIVKRHTNSPYTTYGLESDTTDNLRIVFYNQSETLSYARTANSFISTGVWYYVVGVKEGNNLRIYVDGQDETNTTFNVPVSGTVYNGDNNFQVGAFNSSTNRLAGVVDTVKLYDYSRNEAQITQDMNAGHPAPGSPIGSAIAYWRFNEGQGTTAFDANTDTGGAEDLTLSTETSSWSNNGKFGKAFSAGGSRRLTRTDDNDLDFTAASDMTISLWLNSTISSGGNPSATEYLINKPPSGSTNGGYAVYANTSGQVCFGIDDDSSAFPEDSVCTSSDVYDNTWHNIVAVKSGTSRLDMYLDGKVNGTPDTSLSSTTNTLENSSTFFVASQDSIDDSDDFNGDLDEIQIFPDALTINQAQMLFNQSGSSSVGATSTDSSDNPTWSAENEYCPPGQGTTCTPPVGEWKFDENTGTGSNVVKDTSENGNHGTTSGIAESDWVPGKHGSAFRQNGGNAHVVVGDNDALDFGTGSFTLSMWLRHDTIDIQRFALQKRSTAAYGMNIESTGEIRFGIDDDSSSYPEDAATSTTQIDDGQWHYVVGVLDRPNTDLRIYVDGVLENTDTFLSASGSISNDSDLYFGIQSDGTSADWQGDIDTVRLYDYIRTPAQIAWEYNRGGPVAWWKLNDCTGTTANDNSGKSKNGSITIGGSDTTYTTAGNCGSGTSTEAWNGGTNGKFNYSLGFGGDEYITVSSPGLPTGDFSYTAWFYHVGTASPDTILMASNGSGGNEILLWLDSDDALDAAVNGSTIDTNTIPSNDAWHHAALTRSGSNITLYLDGNAITTASDSNPLDFSTCELLIGVDSDTGCNGSLGNYWDGKLDDIRIYNYALTEQQLKLIMNEGGALRQGPSEGSP